MIKLILFVLTVGLSSNAFASLTAAELAACEVSVSAYGNGKGPSYISTSCVKAFTVMATPSTSKVDGEWNIVGYRNALFITRIKNQVVTNDFIAGSSTRLKNIRSIAIDKKHQEVAVLLATGEVHVFTLKVLGNISAIRIIKSPLLTGATEIEVNSERNEFLIKNICNCSHPKEVFYLEVPAILPQLLSNLHTP